MSKKIMILGASILQLPAIQKAKEMGLHVIAVDMNQKAVGFKEVGIEKEFISTIDIPSVIDAAKRHKIDGIMTLASDMPMQTVAAVVKELGLIGITDDTALKTTNKIIMRQCLMENHVPVPKFYKISNYHEYIEVVNSFTVPFIVKPADNSGSRGVYKLNPNDKKEVIETAYSYSKSCSRNGDVIVEEFMNGEEISVETLSIDGKCHIIQITDKLTTGAPHFVEMGHSQPTHHSQDMVARINKVTSDANHAVGIKNGPSHTEIIITKEGPKIVELGARLGGDCITTHLVPLSTGVDMVKCCIKTALGETTDIRSKWNKGAAVRYFKQHSGVINSIEGIDVAKQIVGVRQISIVHNVGENITEIDSSGSRLGFVIAEGKNVNSAINICEQVLDMITIEIK